MIWPPLILAGAIVFLLNPVVTRLQGRHIPRALGTGALLRRRARRSSCSSVLLVAPLATRQYDDLAERVARACAQDLEKQVNDLSERSEDDQWPIRIPTYQELEDQFSADDAADTNGDGVISEEEKQDRFASQIDTARRAGPQGVPRRDHLRAGADHRVLPARRPPPHPSRCSARSCPSGPAATSWSSRRRLEHAPSAATSAGSSRSAFVVGTMASIGMLIIDLPFWLIVGMVAGLFNMIPLIGPWVGAVPGHRHRHHHRRRASSQAIAVAVVMAIVQQIDNHFISPIVMQRAVKLHPAVVMLALLAGGTLGGFFGLLLAVPATAALKIVVGHAWRHFVLGEPLDEIEARWEAEDERVPGGVVERVGVDDDAGDDRRGYRSDPRRVGRPGQALEAPPWPGPWTSSASSGEAGPAGVGSLMASSARSMLQPVRACSSSASRCPVGGSSRSMITVVWETILVTAMGFSLQSRPGRWLVVSPTHRPLSVVDL